jgi:signal transduction histidine kinase
MAEIFLLMSENDAQVILALKIKFLPVVYIGVSWLYFCLSSTHSKLVENKFFITLIVFFPAACYFFLLTNEWHNLFFTAWDYRITTNGPVFWIHTVESYLCIFIGTVYFFIYYLKRKIGASFKRIMWLVSAVMLPMTASLLMVSGVIPNCGIDITPQVLLLTLILFGLEVYYRGFLNLIPVAARHFILNMSDGIIIIDDENLVAGINESANKLFPGLSLKIYDSVRKLSAYIRQNTHEECANKLADMLEGIKTSDKKKGNLTIAGKSVNMEIRSLTGPNQISAGKMIIVEDRTEEQQLLDEIKNKNELLVRANERLTQSNCKLVEANKRLEKFTETIEELAISRERNRVGREVHDTIGHTLTLLIALVENANSKLNSNRNKAAEILDECIELSRKALNDIRMSLNGTCEETFKRTNLEEWMNYLVKTNSASGVNVEFLLSEDIPALDSSRIMVIYRICQESITNAIRHGQAKKVSIIIKNQKNAIRLYIFNDGKGCTEIKKGYGLTGMEERVNKLGGSISFGSDGEKGFNIIAEIPI